MIQSEMFDKIRDRQIQRQMGSIDVFLVKVGSDIRFYNSAAEAYYAAQQLGGIPIGSTLERYNLYVITKPRLDRRKKMRYHRNDRST